MNLAIVGAGWSGLAAAVSAVQRGHSVTVLEASHHLGGRARSISVQLPDGSAHELDNGQHILIGAYTQTLAMLGLVGVDVQACLVRQPLSLQFADGAGLVLPKLPAPLDALAGMLGARGWRLADKLSLLRMALRWRMQGFTCDPAWSVARLCSNATDRIMQDLVEPLCVSALNISAQDASAQVFLRVLKDSLFSAPGGSNLLLPRVNLTALFPRAAADWLRRHGAEVQTGRRVQALVATRAGWQIDGQRFDDVVLAAPVADSVRIVRASQAGAPPAIAQRMHAWSAVASDLHHTSITTVYAFAPGAQLARPMLALRPHSGPAQFVFDRGQLGGPTGLLAFVVSASSEDRDASQAACLGQGATQLGLTLAAVQTVVEKRATFACTPALVRPPMYIAPGLWASGDYVAGPYPATLEGAVRAGQAVIRSSGSA